jgi:hypothetical protein
MSALLDEFKDIFQSPPSGLPPERGVTHAIPLPPGTPPVFRPMYRMSHTEVETVRKQVAELLDKGYISPSTSPYGAPVLFVAKKDGSLRMVIDYRALNAKTIKNRYPMPRVDDLLDQLAGKTILSTTDLAQGFWQVRITPEDCPKTAFRTPDGHWEFKVLSMGLTNAPATFQALMNRVFAHLLGKSVFIFMDDILIASATPEDHVRDLRQVFTL